MRPTPRPLHALVRALVALSLVASGCLPDSPRLEALPDPGGCDVVITQANAATTLGQLNDAARRVFCVDPGDYRSAGKLMLTASGTPSSRRFLRFNAPPGTDQKAIHRTGQAIFESFQLLQASWWVIQGIAVAPRDPATVFLIKIDGGDHNVLDGNLIDASQQWNEKRHVGVAIASWQSDPATYNSVQANVVRGGNRSRLGVDYTGVAVSSSVYAGANNDFNKILDNEIYDWGDGIQLSGDTTCSNAGRPRGTWIEGNDIYITAAKRADCLTGLPDPGGECSCSEDGIDLKVDPGSEARFWTRITNNRLWGFRPTAQVSCGGSGSNGQAITAGNTCPGHVFVGNNVIMDVTTGVLVHGSQWILAGNLFHDVRNAGEVGGSAIHPSPLATGLEIQFNTVVGVDDAYDDASKKTDTRCNAVIENLGRLGPGNPRGSEHLTRYNFLYDSPTTNFVGTTNQTFASAEESQGQDYCFWRKRWTQLQFLCIPLGHTTPDSPHHAAAPLCESNLGSRFGLGPITFP